MNINLKAAVFAVAAMLGTQLSESAVKRFEVAPREGHDMTAAIQRTVDRAARWQSGHPADTAVVALRPGSVYEISRKAASQLPYHVSNTASKEENPATPLKHVGIVMRNLRNFIFDGCGARILTHGEMTPWVIDRCEGVAMRRFAIDAADPSVAEMTVVEVDDTSFTAEVNPRSRYEIVDGKLWWTGDGWRFTDGIAQLYDPSDTVTLRCGSPVVDARRVEESAPGRLRFIYGKAPGTKPGITYQMRHSFRNEVGGLIVGSDGVELRDIDFHFLGNFGIVAQTSGNISYRSLRFAPDAATTGRTAAGFADFLQVSGCRGKIIIDSCLFAGSHDDPINIHGTHLRVVGWADGGRRVTLRYMHPQTFGFQSFFPSDSVEFVSDATLLAVGATTVKNARLLNDYEIEVEFSEAVDTVAAPAGNTVVENITWTPSAEITNCVFRLTPTRAILVSTRRSVTIADNLFERIPMASVLIADDARSWFESGPVRDVRIERNRFVDCSRPQVLISPENSATVAGRWVHSGIDIVDNEFLFGEKATRFGQQSGVDVRARSVDGLRYNRNTVVPADLSTTVILENCRNVEVD